jgi:hypothetical protein
MWFSFWLLSLAIAPVSALPTATSKLCRLYSVRRKDFLHALLVPSEEMFWVIDSADFE